ncbi:hypothetical protein OM076_07125 [Solirubrobacter ginsenosidimutans]|uniref:Integral membrane protein n=1 Tax=Solirubrobacter ginsenosidimutans TaxID=490573 RepID=A0A9X3MQP7_9ACTN|nr:hypothetical protein [Solirubrobacter ginsenosidimutans]MDA0160027.1 hypothetical protein [Solirubrobacter ginsenosidimutans]
MADEDLVAEVERLRAENDKLQRKTARRERRRRAAVVGLLVLGCGLAALSVVAIWLRVTLLDTDRYVNTVAPIAAQPAVQQAVADKLDTAINQKIDFSSLAQQVLPDRADVLGPVIETGVQGFIRTRIDEFTKSPRFQELWIEANRRAHTRLVELLVGGQSKRLVLDNDTVYLDLSPVIERIKTGLQDRGLTRIADAIPPTVDGRIELVQSQALVSAQKGVKLLKAIAILLPVLAVLCLAGSVYLSRPRLRGLLRAGIGVALAMLLLVAALGIARSAYLDALGNGALPRDAASGIFDAVVAFLRHGLRIVTAVAVALALVAFIFGLPLGKVWNALVTDSRRTWIAEHRNPLLIADAVIAGLWLLLRNPLTGGAALVILLVAAIAAGAIALLGLQAGDSVADEFDADHQGDHGHDHGVVGGHP